MKSSPVRILKSPSDFVKFCTKNDRAFGCKAAFNCYVSCPLWLAREVEFLTNEKGMTIGEAHKASLRSVIEEKDKADIMKEAVQGAMQGQKEYPEKDIHNGK